MKCTYCNYELKEKQFSENEHGLVCQSCGKKGTGETKEKAFESFKMSQPTQKPANIEEKEKTKAVTNNNQVQVIPNKPNELYSYLESKKNEIRTISAPFVTSDNRAFEHMVNKNIRYVINQKDPNFTKVWKNPEGQQSIVEALEEAFSLGATLPEMGYIIPFGNVVEFLPKFEAYEFALTTGKKPPFKWIMAEMIYSNDEFLISRKNGEFNCETKKIGTPRGDLIQIAVYGHNNKLGMVIGDVYDKDRLLKKAVQHSSVYKYYLRDMELFEYANSEGKIKKDNGREYIEKEIRSNGGTWTKKIYKDDLVNPYGQANLPEMLRKMAAKSFLRPFIMVRNSESAFDDLSNNTDKNIEDMIDKSFGSPGI